LKQGNEDFVDFEDSVQRWLDKHECSDAVRKILLEVCEE